jgi:hypothetical protein
MLILIFKQLFIFLKMCCSVEPGDLDCPYQRTDNGYPRYLDTIVDNIKDEVACEVQCTFYDQV